MRASEVVYGFAKPMKQCSTVFNTFKSSNSYIFLKLLNKRSREQKNQINFYRSFSWMEKKNIWHLFVTEGKSSWVVRLSWKATKQKLVNETKVSLISLFSLSTLHFPLMSSSLHFFRYNTVLTRTNCVNKNV